MSRNEFLNNMTEIYFRDNCKTKEAAIKAIIENNMTWNDFSELFPDNYLIYKEDYDNFLKQRGDIAV